MLDYIVLQLIKALAAPFSSLFGTGIGEFILLSPVVVAISKYLDIISKKRGK